MAGSSYSTAQIARAAGASYRQLDYWVRIGLIEPSIADAAGQGTRRQWSADDIARVRRIADVSRRRLRLVYGLDDDSA